MWSMWESETLHRVGTCLNATADVVSALVLQQTCAAFDGSYEGTVIGWHMPSKLGLFGVGHTQQ